MFRRQRPECPERQHGENSSRILQNIGAASSGMKAVKRWWPAWTVIRARLRPEMTTVYSTYRDIADITPPGVFSILLRVFELQAVFAVAGGVALGLTVLSTKIHPRLAREKVPSALARDTAGRRQPALPH